MKKTIKLSILLVSLLAGIAFFSITEASAQIYYDSYYWYYTGGSGTTYYDCYYYFWDDENDYYSYFFSEDAYDQDGRQVSYSSYSYTYDSGHEYVSSYSERYEYTGDVTTCYFDGSEETDGRVTSSYTGRSEYSYDYSRYSVTSINYNEDGSYYIDDSDCYMSYYGYSYSYTLESYDAQGKITSRVYGYNYYYAGMTYGYSSSETYQYIGSTVIHNVKAVTTVNGRIAYETTGYSLTATGYSFNSFVWIYYNSDGSKYIYSNSYGWIDNQTYSLYTTGAYDAQGRIVSTSYYSSNTSGSLTYEYSGSTTNRYDLYYQFIGMINTSQTEALTKVNGQTTYSYSGNMWHAASGLYYGRTDDNIYYINGIKAREEIITETYVYGQVGYRKISQYYVPTFSEPVLINEYDRTGRLISSRINDNYVRMLLDRRAMSEQEFNNTKNAFPYIRESFGNMTYADFIGHTTTEQEKAFLKQVMHLGMTTDMTRFSQLLSATEHIIFLTNNAHGATDGYGISGTSSIVFDGADYMGLDISNIVGMTIFLAHEMSHVYGEKNNVFGYIRARDPRALYANWYSEIYAREESVKWVKLLRLLAGSATFWQSWLDQGQFMIDIALDSTLEGSNVRAYYHAYPGSSLGLAVKPLQSAKDLLSIIAGGAIVYSGREIHNQLADPANPMFTGATLIDTNGDGRPDSVSGYLLTFNTDTGPSTVFTFSTTSGGGGVFYDNNWYGHQEIQAVRDAYSALGHEGVDLSSINYQSYNQDSIAVPDGYSPGGGLDGLPYDDRNGSGVLDSGDAILGYNVRFTDSNGNPVVIFVSVIPDNDNEFAYIYNGRWMRARMVSQQGTPEQSDLQSTISGDWEVIERIDALGSGRQYIPQGVQLSSQMVTDANPDTILLQQRE